MQPSQNYIPDEISIYLENALNPDLNIRKQAEDKITQLYQQDFGKFLFLLSEKLPNEQEKKQVRQMGATLIKNLIIKEEYTDKYLNLSEQSKTEIKKNILSTLASGDVDIRKAAALTVAGICRVEIPKKQWLDIFELLLSTSQNENMNIQLSSLTCLEYIYEEIKPSDLSSEIIVKLLNTYYSLLTKENLNEELCYNTLKSVLKFLPFIREIIKDYENQIGFYNLIEKFIRNKNKIIRELALKIFIQISILYYDTLGNYIDKIFNFSKPIIEEDVESNKILCMEIWINIGYEEDFRLNSINQITKQSLGFLQKYHLQLSELCLKFIVTEDYYNEEYTISGACFFLLSVMSRTCQKEFLKNMIDYIGKTMNGQNQSEKIKYSGLNVFRAIINTRYKEDFYPIVKDSLGIVSQILIDNNYSAHFKKLCAFILKSITKNFGEELVTDIIYFNKMIELFIGLFSNSSKEVLYTLILALHNLIKSISWSPGDQTNVLSRHMQSLSEHILRICSNTSYYDTENNIICISFLLLGTLGERAGKDIKNYMTNLFKILIDMFAKTLKLENFPSLEIAYNYQEYIAASLSGFLTTGMATPESCGNLLEIIINTFQMRKDLYDEGITLIGCICQFTKENFIAVMDRVSPYVIKGLKSTDSPAICRASVICLSDIFQGLGNNNKYVGDYLPLIMNILSSNSIDRALKPFCFNIISDLFIYCENEVFKYFDQIMAVIGGAMEATKVTLPDDTDIETINNFIDLREHLLENVTCIFSAIKDIQKTKEFIPYVKVIVQYINLIANDSLCCSISILADGLFLIGDFCECYKSDIRPLLQAETIKNMITKIENDKEGAKEQKIGDALNWAKNCINNVFKN